MNELFVSFLLLTLLMTIQCNNKPVNTRCVSPQYLELGKIGIINCMFPKKLFAVLWYTASDFENGIPTIRYQDHVTSGHGYESGKFDVYPNGSLIINEILLRHDDIFTVAYTQTEQHLLDVINVRVTVIVKPVLPFPLINQCQEVSDKCFAEVVAPIIQCSVSGVRPNITLTLLTRTVYGDRDSFNNVSVIPEGEGYTTSVSISDVFRYSPLFVFLVCEASGLPGMLEKNESKVLVLNGAVDITKVKPKPFNIKYNTNIKLNCTDTEVGFVVWKKASSSNYKDQELLMYSVIISEGYTEIFADDVIWGDTISLVIHSVQVKHEGMYFCFFGDGLSDGVTVYNVTVIVPAYPMIDGCNPHQYCILKAEYEGKLMCEVKGIRPQVHLRWKTFSDGDAALISFTDHQLTTRENGETFDVILVSQYRVRDESRDKLAVECEVVASEKDLLGLTIKMELLFVKGLTTDSTSNSLPWVIPVIVAVCIGLVVCGVIITRCLCKQKMVTIEVGNTEELTSMFEGNRTDADRLREKKEQFLKQLRETYKDLYDAIQPIPYIKEKLHCVDRVFVEGGIEYLDSRGETKGQWTSLDSYQNVFDDSKVKSTRRILEGEPGYGKSTVTLQFAYDWCNSVQTSALRDVDILVLLRLRQLEGVISIYRAIKQFILPKDSRLLENDIENILQESHSVVIILDGFDEYPDQDNTTSDVISIIARQMFQEYEVVLTTRSSFLPMRYPPLTKRLRLTGFDDTARRYYIRKAVVGDDDEDSVLKIEGYLEENPILRDLCQVPLLFVIFAHMTYESEHFRKLNSVTRFFRYMISSFHSHLRNKMNEENVSMYELFETNHCDLDKIAFKALSGDSQRIVWKKDQLCQQLGQEFYDQYIRIGILVEEEVINIIDDPSTPINEHAQYNIEVRFYHKLFCEWYAAHYLSDYIQQNNNLDLSEYLRHLNPFDVQYLYRFSCGLNSNSSEKIIDYLKNIEGGDKFAILCILEQTGKIDNIKETIRQLCSEGVIISGHDSLLLQRSSMQLLEIAARNDIPIRGVFLYNCFQSVDLSTSAIRATSSLVLTSRIPVKELVVELLNREMTEDEYIDILEFSSMCPSLSKLRFRTSAPPRSFKVGPALSTLCSRNVTVRYEAIFKKSPKHILNILTGRWERENDGLECTEEDFERINLDWAELLQDNTDEYYKRDVQSWRENLRRKAEKIQNNDDERDIADNDDDNDGVNLDDENHN